MPIWNPGGAPALLPKLQDGVHLLASQLSGQVLGHIGVTVKQAAGQEQLAVGACQASGSESGG